MPKGKTKKAAAKRFRISARGKVKHAKPGRGHLLSGKTRKRKRELRGSGILGVNDGKRVSGMLHP